MVSKSKKGSQASQQSIIRGKVQSQQSSGKDTQHRQNSGGTTLEGYLHGGANGLNEDLVSIAIKERNLLHNKPISTPLDKKRELEMRKNF